MSGHRNALIASIVAAVLLLVAVGVVVLNSSGSVDTDYDIAPTVETNDDIASEDSGIPSPTPDIVEDSTPDSATDEPTTVPDESPTLSVIVTPSPDPTPERVFGDIDVQLAQWHMRPDGFGDLEIFGEIWNHGGEPAEILQVTLTVWGADGEIVDSGLLAIHATLLPAGGMTPFQATLLDPPEMIDTVDIEVEAYLAGTVQEIEAEHYLGFDLARADWGHGEFGPVIEGEIVNSGDRTASHIMILVSLYDEEGTMMYVAWTISEQEQLEPGGSTGFFVDFIPDELPQPDEIRVLAEGWVVQ